MLLFFIFTLCGPLAAVLIGFLHTFLSSTNAALAFSINNVFLAFRDYRQLGEHTLTVAEGGEKKTTLQSGSLCRLYFTPSCWWTISLNIFLLLWTLWVIFWQSEALWSIGGKNTAKSPHWIWSSCNMSERERPPLPPPSLKLSAFLPRFTPSNPLFHSVRLCPVSSLSLNTTHKWVSSFDPSSIFFNSLPSFLHLSILTHFSPTTHGLLMHFVSLSCFLCAVLYQRSVSVTSYSKPYRPLYIHQCWESLCTISRTHCGPLQGADCTLCFWNKKSCSMVGCVHLGDLFLC